MAGLQSAHVDPAGFWELVTTSVAMLGVVCWGVGPFSALIGIVLLLRDPWRRQRPRREKTWLRLLVIGSPIAWFLSNAIVDSYHLLR